MPKIVNFDEKIDFICEKAYEEFIKNGVNNFSLNKFIESLNMSKGQFYYYFKTKEELIFEVIDKKSEKFFIDTEKEINEAQTFSEKLLALFSFYLVLSDPENKSFDKLMKDTFYMYLNVENEFIKEKNAECYDYLFSVTNEIFDDMIAKKVLKENAKNFIPSLIATADGMYLQSMILENYDLKKNLIDYIKMLEDLLKR
ncbi:TetR/AcrR family transcriptional regulator [Malaciobacter mytili]|uniref:TetR family transcriptional regulator n=1 Tax=Malaciobacter mytili LMG 24559 TaxID=1032238 RepID=A0AAX2AJQ0_9BACT|nr:TetR/AcrR family transcriptional regulator [Malaciobacter mytili]AXH14533.1 transcriptional regulator, TetR/AcrR family [Malaciobacter mytili LMG 24559]RXI45026.1 TetR family transcriptional regulator [Malaciobacter mytili]RXK16587.1 TetR family transcriptional regulator [Malaciobacter mytili LMG 24559]